MATTTSCASASTRRGSTTSVPPPWPCRPPAALPHEKRAPPSTRHSEWQAPAATALTRTPASPRTGTGTAAMGTDPTKPPWPRRPRTREPSGESSVPQEKSCPSSPTKSECDDPAAATRRAATASLSSRSSRCTQAPSTSGRLVGATTPLLWERTRMAASTGDIARRPYAAPPRRYRHVPAIRPRSAVASRLRTCTTSSAGRSRRRGGGGGSESESQSGSTGSLERGRFGRLRPSAGPEKSRRSSSTNERARSVSSAVKLSSSCWHRATATRSC
mmetsp:Transcript_9326/g.27799  ORF Transcript_9326/g.27799 Transcript_9326/m.27799 type:complete len:274 (-) Transcript_9326:105-926(-)